MSEAKMGDTVKVHYTGKLNDGTVFDSSQGQDPLEFEIGSRRLLQPFETGVIGMTVGESRTVTVEPLALSPGHRGIGEPEGGQFKTTTTSFRTC